MRSAMPLQGGDTPAPYLQLDPLGMGVSWKYLVIPPDSARRTIDGPKLRAEMEAVASGMRTTGHHDPDDPGNHRTDTIDLDYILEGDVELELAGSRLGATGAGRLSWCSGATGTSGTTAETPRCE